MPRQTVAIPILPYSSVCIAWMKPAPTVPRTALSGTSQSSNISSAVGEPRKPILSKGLLTEKPFVPLSTRTAGDAGAGPFLAIVVSDYERHVGDGRVRDEGLGPVQDPLVALLHGARLDGGSVAARFRFGQAEAADDLSLDDAGKVLFLLLGRAEEPDRHAEETARRAAREEGGGAGLGHLLAGDCLADEVDVGAAVRLLMAHAEEADVRKLLDVFLDEFVHLVVRCLVEHRRARLYLLRAELGEVLLDG